MFLFAFFLIFSHLLKFFSTAMKNKTIPPSLHRNPESLNVFISGVMALKSSASNKIKYKIMKINKSARKRKKV